MGTDEAYPGKAKARDSMSSRRFLLLPLMFILVLLPPAHVHVVPPFRFLTSDDPILSHTRVDQEDKLIDAVKSWQDANQEEYGGRGVGGGGMTTATRQPRPIGCHGP